MDSINFVVAGVYVIRCKADERVYVGASSNVAVRFKEHKWALIQGTHANRNLQHAWCMHGQDAFDFQLVEEVDDHAQMLYREQFWLDECPNLYNISKIAVRKGFRTRPQLADVDQPGNNPALELERFLNIKTTDTARVLGVAYPTYAAYKSGARVLPRYHQNQIVLIMMLAPDQVEEYVAMRLEGKF